MRTRSSLGLAALLALFCTPAHAQPFPLDTVLLNGPPAERINLVFLAEGYQSSEMGKFRSDVQTIVNGLLAQIPISTYAAFFNAFAVEVPSVESGTDHPGTAADEPGGIPVQFRNTYFNSSFDVSGVHRALVADNGKVFNVLASHFPMWDAAFVIVNTSWYGGTGGSVSTFSTHPSTVEIALHEMGHSFGDLADEYDYGAVPGHESPNSTSETDRADIRWNDWILPTTPVPTPETGTWASAVGLFEGAVYNVSGWYRPKLNCKMQSLGVAFCEVCREQLIKTTHSMTDLIGAVQPGPSYIEVPNDSMAQFSVNTLTISPNTAVVDWTVDDDTVWTGPAFTLQAENYEMGLYVITALVRDSTAWVRTDPGDLLSTSHQWTMRIVLPTVLVGDFNGDRVVTSADLVQLVNYVFKGGPAPSPMEAGDVDCSATISSADIIGLVNYIFKSGPRPDC